MAALIYLKRQFGARPRWRRWCAWRWRLSVAVGVARLVPGEGKLITLVTLPLAGIVFLAALILIREFGPEDRAKFARILGKRH